jgi:hypothetical protein
MILIIVITYGVWKSKDRAANMKILNEFPKPQIHLREPRKDEIPIWGFWDSDDWPLLVKVCVKSWLVHNPKGYVVNVLSLNNFKRFVDESELPKMFDLLSPQHKSDVIRLCLLKKYGGYWIDSTLLLTKPLKDMWEPIIDYDVAGFNADHFQTVKSQIVLENWFIVAPKNSKLIADWHDEFVRGFDRQQSQSSFEDNRTEYLQSLMDRGVNLQVLRVVRPRYFSMHCAFLAITNPKTLSKKYRIKYASAGINNRDAMGPLSYTGDRFQPLFPCGWCAKEMLTSHYYSDLPMIKFDGTFRKMLTPKLWQSLKPDSTIGRIVYL